MVHLGRDTTTVHEAGQGVEMRQQDQSVHQLWDGPIVFAICKFLDKKKKNNKKQDQKIWHSI